MKFRFSPYFLFPIVIIMLLPILTAYGQTVDIFKISAPDRELFERSGKTLLLAKVELDSILGLILVDTVRVFIAQSRNDFDTATFGGAPDWGVGVTLPSKSLIAILSPVKEHFDLPFEEVLRHELAHLALARRVDNHRLPRFMDEGFAMTFAHEWKYGDDLILAKARFTGSLFALSQIDYVNMLNPSQARIAYAESFQAVKYILDTFGRQTFRDLLDGFRAGHNRDMVFKSVLGSDFDGFEKLFADYVAAHYHWLMIFTDPIILWTGLALIVIIGFLLIRRRKKNIYKKWEEEEKLESTDFDYEEPSQWD